MKTLFVGWQQDTSREWLPVARLDKTEQGYRFAYTRGAQRASGFRPFGRMDRLDSVYQAESLFPLFANRILPRTRPEFPDYFRWTGLPTEAMFDPLPILAVTGGIRGTDAIELFPAPQRTAGGGLRIDFFARGLRHFARPNIIATAELSCGDRLHLMRDLQNEHDRFALCLRTEDPAYLVGYCPKYYTRDICRLLDSQTLDVIVRVKQVNSGAPLSMRLLCSLESPWPRGFEPFDGNPDFDLIAAS